MARASAPTSTRSWCRPCSPATSSLPTTSGPTRSPPSNAPSRLPGPPSGTCHPIARTSIPSSSASRSSRPSFAPHAVAAARRSGRSSVPVSSISALTNAATIFGTAGTQPPHGHEKRSKARTDRTNPSVWRKGKLKTSRRTNAVSIVTSENRFCPPGRPEGDGRHASVASAESHRVTSPHWTSARSHSRQFPTRYVVLYFGDTLDFISRIVTTGRGNRTSRLTMPAEVRVRSHAPKPLKDATEVEQVA